MSYDSRCYDIAEVFLAEEPLATEAWKEAVAQAIQHAAENEIERLNDEASAEDKP